LQEKIVKIMARFHPMPPSPGGGGGGLGNASEKFADVAAAMRASGRGEEFGRKWEKVGRTKPASGRDLTPGQPDLAEKLVERTTLTQPGEKLVEWTTLTQEEWAKFGVDDLRVDDYIRGGETYFKPSLFISPRARGLKFKRMGAIEPTNGRELSNDALAGALKSKTDFATDEWDDFGISDLRFHDFIKAGDCYFIPVYAEGSVAKLETALEPSQVGAPGESVPAQSDDMTNRRELKTAQRTRKLVDDFMCSLAILAQFELAGDNKEALEKFRADCVNDELFEAHSFGLSYLY